MNYEMFQNYSSVFRFDKVKIIGKEVCFGGEWIHIVCMGQKEDGTYICILERQPALEENPVWRPDRTNRESLLESSKEHVWSALNINKITIGGDTFELQGGSGGNLAQQAELAQAYIFFQQMMEHGWRIPEDSCFYQLGWDCMGLTELRLRDSYEELPELSGEITRLELGPTSRSYIVQVPVQLKRGETDQLYFTLEDGGEEVICYIDQVSMSEPLIEEQKRFDDVQYQEKALQHITREEFEKMRQTVLETIESECPNGMGYFTVEYECTKENLSAQFFAAAYLDSIPEPKMGCTSMIMVSAKPEQEIGPHGYRNRCAVVKYAVPVGTERLDAELFMMIETIPGKEVIL